MKNYIKTVISILMMLYISLVFAIGLKLFNIPFVNDMKLIVRLDLIISLTILIISSIMYFNIIKSDIKKKISVKKVFIYCAGLFLVKIIAASVAGFIGKLAGIEISSSENQALLENMLKSGAIIMVFTAGIIGPIYEELIFRGGYRLVLKDKRVFAIISGLTFGLIHVTDSLALFLGLILVGLILETFKNKKLSVALISLVVVFVFTILALKSGGVINLFKAFDPNEAINAIVYIALGIYLGYVYIKEDNIVNNMIVHSVNNLFSLLLLIFL